ncbi:hypothetical protein GCM10011290_01370 [Vogesella alkaliphila]|uniref:Uncharacterized protein n=1 Tax=Vogesella alkaliphila TaxID=1193621 RepID=A0ABQ2YAY1_9NEIS|nr:hypothetical protein GCM10011290_01370 [Vogesella alkaliphila]
MQPGAAKHGRHRTDKTPPRVTFSYSSVYPDVPLSGAAPWPHAATASGLRTQANDLATPAPCDGDKSGHPSRKES